MSYYYPQQAQSFVGQSYAPQLQQQVAYQPQLASSYVVPPQQQYVAGNTQASFNSSQGLIGNQVKAPLRGNSRVEYVPYQRKVVDYEQQYYTQTVPKERYVTDYYAIEHTTNYVPQTYYDPYVDYVPVQRYKERVEYYPVESSRTVINRQP